MNFTQLSERLMGAAGWSINAVGIRRIESGERRVTPDDLMALAVALGVSPTTLLMPNSVTGDESVEATGVKGGIEARRLWRWLRASAPLLDVEPDVFFTYLGTALPPWWLPDVAVVESGVEPHLTRFVLERGNADGDD